MHPECKHHRERIYKSNRMCVECNILHDRDWRIRNPEKAKSVKNRSQMRTRGWYGTWMRAATTITKVSEIIDRGNHGT